MGARFSSPVLVGRENLLQAMTAAIAASFEGAPRFIVVRGEAGIGKSRLVREALDVLPAGTGVLFGECLDIGAAGLPYLPLVEALRRLARTTDPATLEALLGPGRADLALLVPDLAAPGSPDDPVTSSPTLAMSGLAQARLFERVLALLRALAARAPTVLVIEDVHWIDRATRDLLTFLARNLTDERLAVVLTVRTDDLPRGHPILAWLAELERLPTTVVIEPQRLGRVAVEHLLREIAGGALEPALAAQIWRRSDGNPLFVEELCAVRGSGTGAPRSVVEVLLARVARLDPGARAVVDAVAVAGRPVDDRLVADVLELVDGEVDDRIRQAHELGVLELEAQTDRHRFRHELLREVVERELLPGARRRLHERFARLLEAHPDLAEPSPAGAAGELALHYAEAGLADEAYAWSIAAAEAAEAVHAYADAHRQFERALDLERHRGGASDLGTQVDLRTRAADAADLAGDPGRSLELTRDALARLDPATDPAAAGVLHSRIGYLQWSLGDGPAALASHEEAVRLVPAAPPTAVRARVLGSLGGALMGEGRWAESRALCEAAIACAMEADAPAEESRARNMLGSDLVALGEVDAGLDELRAACRIAAAAGRTDMRIVGHHNLALNLLAADHLEDAVAEARTGIAVARDAGLERRFGQDLAAIVADALTRLGRLDGADRAAAEGLALDPLGHGTVYLSTVVARLAAMRGDTATHDRRRGELDLATLDPDVAAFVAAVAAEAWLWADRPDDAIAEAEAGLGRLEGLDDVLWTAPLVALGLRGLADRAEAVRPARSSGESDADPRLEAFRERLEVLAPRVSTTSGGGWVALGRGEIARAGGGEGDAPWRDAIAAFDAVPAPLEAAYARLRAAEAALRARGLRADVATLVREAADAAGEAGAGPLARAVATLAARARIPAAKPAAATATPVADVPDTAGGGPGNPHAAAAALGLSAREIEVLELVTAGYTNGEIAERLFITRKTAAVHVTHILDKLGVANRVGAAMIGARVGLGADRANDEG